MTMLEVMARYEQALMSMLMLMWPSSPYAFKEENLVNIWHLFPRPAWVSFTVVYHSLR
jgi:hypothetical protein